MRADRLLSILLLLQVNQSITARELARRLEVSERTIYRDMDALSAAGVPVYAERGTGGGWRMQEAYQTNLTGLNETEVQALFLTRPAHLLRDLGLHQASEAALIKLLAALPALSRQDAEYARQRIHVDGAGWHQSKQEHIPCLPTLQDAIWQERKIRFTYARGDGTVEREADPLGLVAKRNVWYLVAAVEGEVRSYRVSRVHSVTITEQPCVRPADFDLAAYWEQSTVNFKANLPSYHVCVRVAPDLLPQLRGYHRVEQEEPPDADGWTPFRLRFDVEHEACSYILGCGSSIEVIEPVVLRERVIQAAKSILALYAQQSKPA